MVDRWEPDAEQSRQHLQEATLDLGDWTQSSTSITINKRRDRATFILWYAQGQLHLQESKH
jgi:hypothetical protein